MTKSTFFSLVLRLKRSWLIFLAIPAVILTTLAKANPKAVERVYSSGIYPPLSAFGGMISGYFKFSLAQWIVTLLPLSLIIYIILKIKKIIKCKSDRRENIAKLLATLMCIAGIVWFGFTALCGLNYHRQSITVSTGLEVKPSSSDELAALCIELAQSANLYSGRINRNEDNVMESSFTSWYDAAAFAPTAYYILSQQPGYSALQGFCPPPKPVLGSKVMSLLDIVGVYFPFSFEANVNVDIPDYNIPSAMLHELAHYKGFMREEEANFLSYMACVSSGNDDFAYSGIMLALIHCTNALYDADINAYREVMDILDADILSDFVANSAYWRQFEGPVAKVSEKVNDVYLKTNSQVQGVKSYGYMVDLMLADYRARQAA